MRENEISAIILDAAIEVHRALGPGLYESVYEVALAHVLGRRGLAVRCQVPVPLVYEGIEFDQAFRADMIVAGRVLVELKSVEQLGKVHKKQVLTYLRLTGLRLGILVNFGGIRVVDGFHRIANGVGEGTGA